MTQNRLEIKIIKDIDKTEVNLQALSLRAAKSFIVLVDSITKIIELTSDNNDITIQIKSGSAVVAAQGDKISKVKKEFEKIIENKSTNKGLTEQWRNIQSIFSLNGLQYEANFYEAGNVTSIYDLLVKRGKLRTKPKPLKKSYTELHFLKGKLIAVGGKNPNIHVETDEIILPPITCTEVSANKAKRYLYETIRFSAWKTGPINNPRYILCDSYFKEEMFAELYTKHKQLFNLEEVEMLKKLHYECRFYLDKQDYGTLRKFLRLFIHESTDINILKMILIVTQSISMQEPLKHMIFQIQALFNDKLKKLYKNSSTE